MLHSSRKLQLQVEALTAVQPRLGTQNGSPTDAAAKVKPSRATHGFHFNGFNGFTCVVLLLCKCQLSSCSLNGSLSRLQCTTGLLGLVAGSQAPPQTHAGSSIQHQQIMT